MALLNLPNIDLGRKISPLSFGLSGMGFTTLSKIWMLQRKYNWQLMMPENIEGIMGMFVSQYCQDVKFGDYSISKLSSIQYGAVKRFYAGVQEIKTASLTFVAPVDNSVLEYFYGWYNLMIDTDGFYHPKSEYKKTIFISMYDRSGVESVRFTLLGVFPITKPAMDLSYTANEIQHYTIGLNVDYLEMYSLVGSILKTVTKTAGSVLGKIVGVGGV